jgi:hypothetical protein
MIHPADAAWSPAAAVFKRFLPRGEGGIARLGLVVAGSTPRNSMAHSNLGQLLLRGRVWRRVAVNSSSVTLILPGKATTPSLRFVFSTSERESLDLSDIPE